MASYETLRKMAGLIPTTNPSQQADKLYSDSFSKKSKEWEVTHTKLPAQENFTLWELNIGTKEFAASNPKEYHETRERLHPLGKEAARKEYRDVLDLELVGLDSASQETIIKNRARELPAYALDYLDRVASLQQVLDGKYVNRALRNNVEVHSQIFAGLDFTELDTDGTKNSHLDDLMKTVDMGRANDVVIHKGRVSLPDPEHPDGYSPVFSYPFLSDLGLEQLKMNRVYVRPVAEKSIMNGYEESLIKRETQEKETLNLEYNKTTDPNTPREFIANALIDRDSTRDDGGILTVGTITDIMFKKAPKYSSYDEMLVDYKDLLTDVFNKTYRRLTDGSDGK